MKFLIDTSPAKMKTLIGRELVSGQLLTPLTRYSNAGGTFAIDNGAYSGFRANEFSALLKREKRNRDRCLFVVCPDVVGNARRTLEIYNRRHLFIPPGWPVALVAQDGLENMDVPWEEVDCLFVGGTEWKDTTAASDLVKTAKILGKHVHIGRVNTFRRWKHFADIGADTCDGSGIAMYDHMLRDIERKLRNGDAPTLFNRND